MWILIISVKDNLVMEISEFEDPQEAWTHLQKSYEVRDVTRKLHLKNQLMSLRVIDDGGIKQYLREFKMIRSQLISIGQQLPEEDTIEILLNALPDSYEAFIIALNGTGELPTLNVLVKSIQHVKSRRILKYSNKDTEEALFVLTKRFSRLGSNNCGSIVVCHYCGKRGYYLNQCRERESDIKKLEDDRRQKFQKRSVNVTEDVPSETLDHEGHDTQEMFDITMATLDRTKDPKWYIDSGASTHVTGRSKILILSKVRQVAFLSVQLVVRFIPLADQGMMSLKHLPVK